MHRVLNLAAITLPHTCELIKYQNRKRYPRAIWPTLYLLHRGRRGAGPYASNPFSFSAEASGLSWIPHGSSPQTPADEQSVECTSMGLHSRYNIRQCICICVHRALSSTLQLGDFTHFSLRSPPLKHSLSDPQLCSCAY